MTFVLPFFLIYSVYGVAQPYLAVLIRDLGYSPGIVGILLGIFEIAGISGPILLGFLSDRVGRYRPGLAAAFVLILVSLFPLITFHTPVISALSLVLFAIGLRSLIPLMDAVATIAFSNAASYGKIRAVGSLGFVAVALLLQWIPVLRPDSYLNISLWIAVFSIISLCSVFILPEDKERKVSKSISPLQTASKEMHSLPKSNSSSSWNPLFIWGLIIIGLGRLAMAPVNSFISLYVVEDLHWDAAGLMWALSAFSEIPIIFFSGLLIKRFAPSRLLAVSIAAIAVRLCIYALFPTKIGVVSGQLLHSICFGLFHPAAVAFVISHVSPAKRAVGLSLYTALAGSLPTFIGSSIGGFIVEAAGYRVLFASFTVFVVIALAVYYPLRKRLAATVHGNRQV